MDKKKRVSNCSWSDHDLAGVSSEDATIGGVSTDTCKMSLGLSMSF
ncbi:hypothetical protein ACTYEO_13365 [Rhodophyticola sp. SM2404]